MCNSINSNRLVVALAARDDLLLRHCSESWMGLWGIVLMNSKRDRPRNPVPATCQAYRSPIERSAANAAAFWLFAAPSKPKTTVLFRYELVVCESPIKASTAVAFPDAAALVNPSAAIYHKPLFFGSLVTAARASMAL